MAAESGGVMSQVRGHLLLAGAGEEMSLRKVSLCNLESAAYSLAKDTWKNKSDSILGLFVLF